MKTNTLEFDESKFKHAFLETSSFSVMFAKHRLEYLRSVESFIKKACSRKNIEYTANYDEYTMEVSTTGRTRDPYVIIKGQSMIELLSKGVPLECAAEVLEEDIFSDIIPTHLLCSNEKTFERRKHRILNPKILKALELLTKCKVFISGKVACVVGNFRGLTDAKSVLISCFENLHPVYAIKELIIKRKLAKENKEGDWSRFMPEIKKTHAKKKVKARTPGGMPEEIAPTKEDIARETGEYYKDPANVEKDRIRELKRAKREEIRKRSRQTVEEDD